MCVVQKLIWRFSNENAHVIRELSMFVYNCYMQRFEMLRKWVSLISSEEHIHPCIFNENLLIFVRNGDGGCSLEPPLPVPAVGVWAAILKISIFFF